MPDIHLISLAVMLPYAEQPALRLGPVTIHAFGAVVAASVFLGLEVARRRMQSLGLDARLGERLAWWTLIGGFLGAHLFSVVFYFPEKVGRNPLVLFKLWEDVSSFGGILGGLLGLWLFVRVRAPVPAGERRRYLDAVAYTFPFGLLVGRLACTVAHDHPGTITRFPLAVSLAKAEAQAYITHVYTVAGRAAELPTGSVFATLGFHDLGWYEFLYLGLVVVPITLWLGRVPRRPGTFVASFILLYMPVRFALDYLRVSDAHYAGLTPAQWVALVTLLPLATHVLRRGRSHPDTTHAASAPSSGISMNVSGGTADGPPNASR